MAREYSRTGQTKIYAKNKKVPVITRTKDRILSIIFAGS